MVVVDSSAWAACGDIAMFSSGSGSGVIPDRPALRGGIDREWEDKLISLIHCSHINKVKRKEAFREHSCVVNRKPEERMDKYSYLRSKPHRSRARMSIHAS